MTAERVRRVQTISKPNQVYQTLSQWCNSEVVWTWLDGSGCRLRSANSDARMDLACLQFTCGVFSPFVTVRCSPALFELRSVNNITLPSQKMYKKEKENKKKNKSRQCTEPCPDDILSKCSGEPSQRGCQNKPAASAHCDLSPRPEGISCIIRPGFINTATSHFNKIRQSRGI